MGMPVITPSTTNRCQAITDLIDSIALEEAALAHILNAEGEKIQAIVATGNVEDMLAVNASVESLIKVVTRLEGALQMKLELFEDCLCKECKA